MIHTFSYKCMTQNRFARCDKASNIFYNQDTFATFGSYFDTITNNSYKGYLKDAIVIQYWSAITE